MFTAPSIEYDKLNKIQKLALFLITLGPEKASKMINHLDDQTVEQICKEIKNYAYVDPETKEKVTQEFLSLFLDYQRLIPGGESFAYAAIHQAKGQKQAAVFLSKAIPQAYVNEDFMKNLELMDIRKLYNLIKDEQPQTIAFVLARLNTHKAVSLLERLEESLQIAVVERLGDMQPVSIEYCKQLVDVLSRQVVDDEEKVIQMAGGVQSAAYLLNELPKEKAKTILTSIEAHNSLLGQYIRRKMFAFDDLIRLSIKDLQRIMREVDSSVMVVAMKTASPRLQEMIFGSVSKRAAQSLKEELQALEKPKAKDIQAAQDQVIQIVKKLEEDGEITIDAESGE